MWLPNKMTQYSISGRCVCLLIPLILISCALAHASLQVEWQEGRLSVNAEKIALSQVLQEITSQTGMEIRTSGTLEEPVSIQLVKLSLSESFARLFANYVIVWKTFSNEQQQPALAWVSEPKVQTPMPTPLSNPLAKERASEEEFPDQREAALSPQERIEMLRELAKQGQLAALRDALFDPDPTVQAEAFALLAKQDSQQAVTALVDMTKSDQATQRRQALQLLYQTEHADEKTVLSALGAALTDEDDTTKGFAIQALTTREGPDAVEHLRHALSDPDPSVRLMIVEQAAQRAHGQVLLQEALADSDEAIRSLASSLLSGLEEAQTAAWVAER